MRKQELLQTFCTPKNSTKADDIFNIKDKNNLQLKDLNVKVDRQITLTLNKTKNNEENTKQKLKPNNNCKNIEKYSRRTSNIHVKSTAVCYNVNIETTKDEESEEIPEKSEKKLSKFRLFRERLKGKKNKISKEQRNDEIIPLEDTAKETPRSEIAEEHVKGVVEYLSRHEKDDFGNINEEDKKLKPLTSGYRHLHSRLRPDTSQTSNLIIPDLKYTLTPDTPAETSYPKTDPPPVFKPYGTFKSYLPKTSSSGFVAKKQAEVEDVEPVVSRELLNVLSEHSKLIKSRENVRYDIVFGNLKKYEDNAIPENELIEIPPAEPIKFCTASNCGLDSQSETTVAIVEERQAIEEPQKVSSDLNLINNIIDDLLLVIPPPEKEEPAADAIKIVEPIVNSLIEEIPSKKSLIDMIPIIEILIEEILKKESSISRKESLIPKQKSPISSKESLIPKQESPIPKQESPIPKHKSPIIPKQESPISKQEDPISKQESSIPKKESPMKKIVGKSSSVIAFPLEEKVTDQKISEIEIEVLEDSSKCNEKCKYKTVCDARRAARKSGNLYAEPNLDNDSEIESKPVVYKECRSKMSSQIPIFKGRKRYKKKIKDAENLNVLEICECEPSTGSDQTGSAEFSLDSGKKSDSFETKFRCITEVSESIEKELQTYDFVSNSGTRNYENLKSTMYDLVLDMTFATTPTQTNNYFTRTDKDIQTNNNNLPACTSVEKKKLYMYVPRNNNAAKRFLEDPKIETNEVNLINPKVMMMNKSPHSYRINPNVEIIYKRKQEIRTHISSDTSTNNHTSDKNLRFKQCHRSKLTLSRNLNTSKTSIENELIYSKKITDIRSRYKTEEISFRSLKPDIVCYNIETQNDHDPNNDDAVIKNINTKLKPKKSSKRVKENHIQKNDSLVLNPHKHYFTDNDHMHKDSVHAVESNISRDPIKWKTSRTRLLHSKLRPDTSKTSNIVLPDIKYTLSTEKLRKLKYPRNVPPPVFKQVGSYKCKIPIMTSKERLRQRKKLEKEQQRLEKLKKKESKELQQSKFLKRKEHTQYDILFGKDIPEENEEEYDDDDDQPLDYKHGKNSTTKKLLRRFRKGPKSESDIGIIVIESPRPITKSSSINFFMDDDDDDDDEDSEIDEPEDELEEEAAEESEEELKQKSEQEPEQELEREPEQEPEQELEREPEQEPEQKLEREPKQEPEQELEQDPEQEPEQELVREPEQEKAQEVEEVQKPQNELEPEQETEQEPEQELKQELELALEQQLDNEEKHEQELELPLEQQLTKEEKHEPQVGLKEEELEEKEYTEELVIEEYFEEEPNENNLAEIIPKPESSITAIEKKESPKNLLPRERDRSKSDEVKQSCVDECTEQCSHKPPYDDMKAGIKPRIKKRLVVFKECDSQLCTYDKSQESKKLMISIGTSSHGEEKCVEIFHNNKKEFSTESQPSQTCSNYHNPNPIEVKTVTGRNPRHGSLQPNCVIQDRRNSIGIRSDITEQEFQTVARNSYRSGSKSSQPNRRTRNIKKSSYDSREALFEKELQNYDYLTDCVSKNYQNVKATDHKLLLDLNFQNKVTQTSHSPRKENNMQTRNYFPKNEKQCVHVPKRNERSSNYNSYPKNALKISNGKDFKLIHKTPLGVPQLLIINHPTRRHSQMPKPTIDIIYKNSKYLYPKYVKTIIPHENSQKISVNNREYSYNNNCQYNSPYNNNSRMFTYFVHVSQKPTDNLQHSLNLKTVERNLIVKFI